jgi:hypothetical protein
MRTRRTRRLALRVATVAAVGTALLGTAAPASAGVRDAKAAVYADDSSGAQALGVIWA